MLILLNMGLMLLIFYVLMADILGGNVDYEQRIATLERELQQIRNNFRDAARVHIAIGGEQNAIRQTVLALILTHPNPHLLEPALRDFLARSELNARQESATKEYLQGLQACSSSLLSALEVALEA